MICINCTHPAESLYVIYSHNHIQLTDCSHCGSEVDKYVEIDNVILFIDLLLLKPGAYRHLVYNSLESQLLSESSIKKSSNTTINNSYYYYLTKIVKKFMDWENKFDTLIRLWILLFIFDIYLKWIFEEENLKRGKSSIILFNTFYSNLSSTKYTFVYPYLYFALYSLLDLGISHFLVQWFICSLIGWGHNIIYSKYIISYTILLSYGAKIFPILMIIWPYDTLLSMNIIKYIANLYLIESLKIVTNLSYLIVISIFIISSLIKFVVIKSLLFILLTRNSNNHNYMTHLVTYLIHEFKSTLHYI